MKKPNANKGKVNMTLTEWVAKAQGARGTLTLTQAQVDDLHAALLAEIPISTPPGGASFIGVPIQLA